MEDGKSQFSITLDSDERVNEVVKYLEKKSVQIAGTGTSESFIYPWIIAMIPISMIREISELEGVVRIRELDKGSPGSNNQRTQPKPALHKKYRFWLSPRNFERKSQNHQTNTEARRTVHPKHLPMLE